MGRLHPRRLLPLLAALLLLPLAGCAASQVDPFEAAAAEYCTEELQRKFKEGLADPDPVTAFAWSIVRNNEGAFPQGKHLNQGRL